jgi:nitrate/nitrite-specific signal transduction histidine kinase
LIALPFRIRHLPILLPCLIGFVAILFLEQHPLINRISISDFSISRLISPVYFFIISVLIFLVFLRGFSTQRLFTRIIVSMATIVFIPIAILTMVFYSNTKLNDTLAAVNSLDQTVTQKSADVQEWTSGLTTSLSSLLSVNDSYVSITRMLRAHAMQNINEEREYRTSTIGYLADTLDQYGFEEIYVFDPDGIVIASTRDDLLYQDYGYYEFFWQGKQNITIIPPRYYPPEEQVSIFITRPIRNFSNEIVGVLSARARVDRIIEIVGRTSNPPFRSTLSYLLNTDGTLITTSSGRPDFYLQTKGAQALLATTQAGNGSYENVDDIPVIGVYHWLPDLKIGIIVEASQAEIFQRLPAIITGNLGIGLLAFFLAAIAATTIVRSITNPISSLVKASQGVIAGNLDIRVESDREDELGTLSDAFNKMTGELKVLVSDLETRVSDRTHDLESRSLELQTAALIARDASRATNVNDLLSRAAQLIRERFGFYHVGIFLNDATDEYAILYAAAGDAGQVLLANNHKLKIGETGIVGNVAKSGEARIALDVGADSVHFRNPLLPYTRSEMSLPLKTESRILGVLDVQSDKVNAFDQNDITIMSILTDQMAIALERTRLIQESGQNATAMEIALQAQTSRSWRAYLSRTQQPIGYRYRGVQMEKINALDSSAPASSNSERTVVETDKAGEMGSTATIPIQLRGQTLGSLKIRFSTDQISENTLQLLEESASRLSLALENARLVQDAQHLASQEQNINIISNEIQRSSDLETILQNTVRELGKTLGVPKAFIQIGFEPDHESTAE